MSEALEDYTTDFSLGMDGYHYPNAIKDNQYARGVNLSPRGSVLGPRPGFWQRELAFDIKTLMTKYGHERSLSQIWQAGKFQACIPYTNGFEYFLITVVCGLIFRTNIDTYRTTLLSETVRVNQRVPRINWSYGADKVVIYDYPDYAVVVDNELVYRDPDIPICSQGTYNQNRLFIAGPTNEFTAGDAYGNDATPKAPLSFLEVTTPSAPFVNQFFTLPTGETMHHIVAMGFLQELDTSTGIGMLFVATEVQLCFFNTKQPRENWVAGQFGGVLLANAGMAGSRTFINLNSDLVFMSPEGQVYALSTARHDSKRWGDIPISREVEVYLKFFDIELSRYASLGAYDNRVLIAANPYRVTALTLDGEPIADYTHGGFVVIDIQPLASLLQEDNPSWNGLWTGVNPIEICNIGKRCFIISKDGIGARGGNALYELMPKETVDLVRGERRRIRSILYTKLYDGKQPFTQKRERTIGLYFQQLLGKIDLLIERKPTHAHKFLKYADWHHDAPSAFEETVPEDEFLYGIAPQELKQLIFGDPDEEGYNPVTNDLYEVFLATQYRLTIEADQWLLDNFRVRSEIVPINEREDINFDVARESVRLPRQPEPDWMIPGEDVVS